MQNWHLTEDGGQWKLKKPESDRASVVFDGTKEDAIKQSAQYVQDHGGGSVKIHKVGGLIQEERTYKPAIDPPKSRG